MSQLYITNFEGGITSFFVNDDEYKLNRPISYEQLQLLRAKASAKDIAGKDIPLKLLVAVFNEYVASTEDYVKAICEDMQSVRCEYRKHKDGKYLGHIIAHPLGAEWTSIGDNVTVHLWEKDDTLDINHKDLRGTSIERNYKAGVYGTPADRDEFFNRLEIALKKRDEQVDDTQ